MVKNEVMIADEVVINKIYFIRGQKVMLDRDLAELYNVETKQLKRQVNRNIDRFPEDFMFEMTNEELHNWRRQFGTSKSEIMGYVIHLTVLPNKVLQCYQVSLAANRQFKST